MEKSYNSDKGEALNDNRKISVYLDKDIYDKFIALCNKQGRSSYDVLRSLIGKVVQVAK